MATDVAGHLAAPGGMTDHDHVAQIEHGDERGEIVSVGIHIVATRGLAGSSMAAPIMSDGTIAMGDEEHHLVVPGVGIERPAMAEDNGLPGAPVLVVEIDRHRVFFPNSKVWHERLPFSGSALMSEPVLVFRDQQMCERLQSGWTRVECIQHPVRKV